MDRSMMYSGAHPHERFYPPDELSLEEPESKPMAGILFGSALGVACWTLLLGLLVLS